MLKNSEIIEQTTAVAKRFPVKSIAFFGSYAEGRATNQSDLDVLVEFYETAVSLLVLADLKYQLEEALGISVDVIHAPIADDSFIKPGKVVPVYAA